MIAWQMMRVSLHTVGRYTLVGMLLASALTAGACVNVRPGHPATKEEGAAARGLVQQIAAVAGQPATAADILAVTSESSILTLLAPAGTPAPISDRTATAGELGSCAIASATSMAWNRCELGTHEVEGTWSAADLRVHAELVDVFILGPELHGSVAVDANLARGAELSGLVDMDVMWSAASVDYALDASLRIDGLVMDADEDGTCASAGTIAITGAFGDGPRGTTTLWFGPGCADVQIAQ